MAAESEHSMRLAGVIRESIVDGPGIRLVVFAQGCPHHCPGCQNPDTHDAGGGYESSIVNVMAEVVKNPLLSGVTISGGEPFLQAKAMAVLAEQVRTAGLTVVTYTGYSIEQILASGNDDFLALLKATDILVDGPFIEAEKDLLLKFRGSKNQRVLDVPASLTAGMAIERDW